MNQLLNNRVGKKKKAQKRGCLFLILGSLLALLATGAFILAVSVITGKVIESRHGDEVAYALMTAVKPCYGIALLLFYAILAVWYVSPTEEEAKRQNQSLSPMLGSKKSQESQALPRRTLWLITAGLFAGVILTGAVCVNTYRLVTPDGIRTYCFVETGRYDWKQATTYVVDCDTDAGLSMTFKMRDGKQYEIMQGVNSATGKFHEQYDTVTEFAAAVDDQMVSLQTPVNVKHYATAIRFYQASYPDLWPYVSQLIRYREVQSGEDEIADTTPVTETETAAES